ncbi:hypothetical protein EDD86DRAFT_208149 [Gorgonomyces haynaldii]|nr:hypothetical protein EDD86DRAFT_208149 [Gorgonomyces haynaldii]
MSSRLESKLERHQSQSRKLHDKAVSETPRIGLDIPSGSLDFWGDLFAKDAPTASPTVYQFARVKSDYAARNQDELTLEEGDLIRIMPAQTRLGFLFGQLNGVQGWFPAIVVSVLSPDEIERDSVDIESKQNSSVDLFRSNSKREKEPTEESHEQERTWYNRYRNMPRYQTKNISVAVSPHQQAASTSSVAFPHHVASPSSATMQSQMSTVEEVEVKRSNTILTKLNNRIPGQRPLWKDLMGQEKLDKLNLSEKEIKRQEVILEIIATEQDYVDDLDYIVEVYIKPLKKSKLVQPKDMAIVFSNIEMLLPVNQELLKSLEVRQHANPVIEQVGDTFIHVSDYLKMYTMYCSNHPYALMKLQSLRSSRTICKFMDQCQQLPESRNLNLANYLLKPVQRVTKYPLLLRELIKATDPSHVDHENLTRALLKIETVVTIINEGARQAENVHKVLELQSKFITKVNIVAPSRSLVKSGQIDMFNAQKEKKKREVYLFNDMLVVAKQDGEKYKLLNMCPFDKFLAEPIKPQGEADMEILADKELRLAMFFDTPNQRDVWLNAIGNAFEDYVAQKNRINQATKVTSKSVDLVKSPEHIKPEHRSIEHLQKVSESNSKLDEKAKSTSSLTETPPQQRKPMLPPKPANIVDRVQAAKSQEDLKKLEEKKSETKIELEDRPVPPPRPHQRAATAGAAVTNEKIDVHISIDTLTKKEPEQPSPVERHQKEYSRERTQSERPISQISSASIYHGDRASLVTPSTHLTRVNTGFSKPVKQATIVDLVRTKDHGSKGFLYIINVIYANLEDQIFTTAHNFEEFFELHLQLLGHFPDAAGIKAREDVLSKDIVPVKRILPELPVQMMHVSEAVAVSRLRPLQEYMDVLGLTLGFA